MSVATLLGLDEPDAGLLEVARMRWPAWQERHAVLRSVDDLADLKGATRRLGPAGSNELLLALAALGLLDDRLAVGHGLQGGGRRGQAAEQGRRHRVSLASKRSGRSHFHCS